MPKLPKHNTTIRVNLSYSFPARTKCPRCNDKYFHYWSNVQYNYHDARTWRQDSDWFRNYIKRLCDTWYLSHHPKEFPFTGEVLGFVLHGKSFIPRIHVKHGIVASGNRIQIISCACGRCVWFFSDINKNSQKEISNRKSRYQYPRKYIY